MPNENTAWQLEDFVDSLVVELDKTRETLAVKAINKPLSYTVKEVALDLNTFPTYDGDQVRFVTARPGEQGASKVSINLGSITDQQVRATSKTPTKSDTKIDRIDVDKRTKKQLRKLGVNSVDDLKQIERRNVDLESVADNEIDYTKLNNQIQKSKRGENPPVVRSVSLSMDDAHRPILHIKGSNLAVDPTFAPVAAVNGVLADVLSGDANEMKVRLGREHKFAHDNGLILTFDPFAVVKVNVRAQRREKP